MADKTYRCSAELFNELMNLRKDAKESVLSIMKQNNLKSIDFTLDEEGRSCEDEDYNEDFFYDNRIWVDCYGKYSNEEGYVTKVEINDKDEINIIAEGECDTYEWDNVSNSAGAYISILEYIEFLVNHKKK